MSIFANFNKNATSEMGDSNRGVLYILIPYKVVLALYLYQLLESIYLRPSHNQIAIVQYVYFFSQFIYRNK